MRGWLMAGLALCGVATAGKALAWGGEAHRFIAEEAYARLAPDVRAEIDRLLASNPAHQIEGCQLATFGDASVWPDCARNTERYKFTNLFHFDSVPLCGALPKEIYCPDGNCATEAIKRYRLILADRTRPDAERLEALAFVVHFVQDIHQPLHANGNGDRGANDVLVRFLGQEGRAGPDGVVRPFNLHGVWDSGLIPFAFRADGVGKAWIEQWVDQYGASWRNADPDVWAAESNDWAWAAAQQPLDTPITCGAAPIGLSNIDQTYIDQAAPVVRLRLAQATARLVDTLDAALGSGR